MKRRNLLLGGVAMAAASVVPTLAMPTILPPILDPLAGYKDFIREYSKQYFDPMGPSVFYGHGERDGEMFEKLNIGLIEQYPELFEHGYMTKPVDIINGETVMAASRALNLEYEFPFIEEFKSLVGLDPEKELVNVTINLVAAKLKDMPKHNIRPVFYIPINTVKAIDPVTFTPLIGFKTRFGDLNKPTFNFKPVIVKQYKKVSWETPNV